MPATTIGEARKVPEVESDVDGMCMDRGHFSATAAVAEASSVFNQVA